MGARARIPVVLPATPEGLRQFLLIKLSEIDAALAVLYQGKGSPEGAIAAPVSSLYLRTDGGASTTLYVKESGTGKTGWVGK